MSRKTALLFGLASTVCWAVSPVLIRMVSGWFTIGFQNFYRYAVSLAILWAYSLASPSCRRPGLLKNVKYAVPKFIIIAAANFTHQYFLIAGIYILFPGLVSILEESTIIFAAVLAFIFFPDERRLVSSPLFVPGLLMAVAGVTLAAAPLFGSGYVQGAGCGAGSFESIKGIVFIMISSLSWAVFSLLIRLWLSDIPAPLATSMIFTIVVPFFLAGTIGEGGCFFPSAPLSAWVFLTLSGILGIGLGYTFFYRSVTGLGVTVSSVLGLLIPVLTSASSFLILGERMEPVQLAGAAVLISGCWLISRIRFAPSGVTDSGKSS